jgi:hypothetical protein
VCLSLSIFAVAFSGLLDSSTDVMCATAAKTLGSFFSGCSFSLNKFIYKAISLMKKPHFSIPRGNSRYFL